MTQPIDTIARRVVCLPALLCSATVPIERYSVPAVSEAYLHSAQTSRGGPGDVSTCSFFQEDATLQIINRRVLTPVSHLLAIRLLVAAHGMCSYVCLRAFRGTIALLSNSMAAALHADIPGPPHRPLFRLLQAAAACGDMHPLNRDL